MKTDEKVFFIADGKEYCNEELALSILLREGILFANSRKYLGLKFIKDDSEKGFHCEDGEIEGETLVLFVTCNDLFYWATADCECLTLDEVPELYRIWETDKRYGVDKWCCKKRNMQPQIPYKKAMKKDNKWEKWMDKLEKPARS